MRCRALIAGMGFLVAAVSAQAADLGVNKASSSIPYAATCTFQGGCSEPYIGAGISESGGSFNIVSTGVSGLADNNLNLFGELGYDYWNGTIFLGANGLAEYGLVSNGTIPGGGNSELWGAGAYAKIGYNVAQAFSITIPTTGNNPLSTLLASTVPYVALGGFCRPWGCGFLSGAGAMGWLSPKMTLHADYLHVDYNNASVNPNVNQQSEDMVIGGIDYHFGL